MMIAPISDVGVVSPSTPPLRTTTSSRTSRRGSPLLIEGTPEPSPESRNRPISLLPLSENGRDTESASDPGLRGPLLQTFVQDNRAHVDEDRIRAFYETSLHAFYSLADIRVLNSGASRRGRPAFFSAP